MHEIKLIVKQILCIKLVKYWDKCTEMHGQQNVKICASVLILHLTTQLFTEHVKNKITELKSYGPSNRLPKAFPYHSLYIQWQRPSSAVLYKSVFIKWLSVNVRVTDGICQIFLRRISNGLL